MHILNQIKKELFELEDLLLQPEIRHNSDKLSELLADEFIEFGSSGRVFTKQEIIDSLQHESSIEMFIHNFEIKELADNLILATYQIYIMFDADTRKTTSLRSSIWKQIDSSWQMIFHQGTKSEIALR